MVLRAEIKQIIETRSDARSRELAEHLIDAGKVHISTLNEAFIKGRVDEVDAELHLKTNSLHLQTNCGCIKKNDQLCTHGLAFLINLRGRLQSKQPRKGVRYWREIVREMDSSDLKTLVIDYARRNKTFAMELQALHVANPRQNSPFEMAEELLDTIKQPIIRSVKKPASSHVRITVNTCKSLFNSARELVKGDYPIEGSKIFVKIIETLHYLAHKRKALDATSGKLIKKSQDQILERLAALRGPEVSEEFYQHLLQLISKSYFAPIEPDFLPDLFGHMKLSEHQRGFLDAIETHISNTEGLDKERWLNIWMKCMMLTHLKEKRPFEPDTTERLNLWKLYSRSVEGTASPVLLDMLYQNVPPTYRKEAFEFALQGELWDHALDILSFGDLSLSSVKSDQAETLLQLAENNGIPLRSEYELVLMEKGGNINRLSSYVKEKGTLKVTAGIIHLNTRENSFICASQLKEQIDSFLIHHIGPASREVVHQLLNGLEKSGNEELFKTIKAYLRDRHDFQDEFSFKSITGLLQ